MPPVAPGKFVEHCLRGRFHQGIDGQLVKTRAGFANDNGTGGPIVCRSRLGIELLPPRGSVKGGDGFRDTTGSHPLLWRRRKDRTPNPSPRRFRWSRVARTGAVAPTFSDGADAPRTAVHRSAGRHPRWRNEIVSKPLQVVRGPCEPRSRCCLARQRGRGAGRGGQPLSVIDVRMAMTSSHVPSVSLSVHCRVGNRSGAGRGTCACASHAHRSRPCWVVNTGRCGSGAQSHLPRDARDVARALDLGSVVATG